MKTFSIFVHPDSRMEVVKSGFSFPGLLAGGFWLLWHKIWTLGTLVAVGGIAVYAIFPNPEGYLLGVPYGHRFGLADIVNVGLCSVVGIWGNEWRSSSLLARGFERVGAEQASTPDGAKAAFLRRSQGAVSEPNLGRREPI
jgi:hypothetical protein